MRKTIAAVAAGLLLVGGQAAAAGSNGAIERVGDRVGAELGDADELGGVPIVPLIIGTAVILTFVYVASEDASESD